MADVRLFGRYDTRHALAELDAKQLNFALEESRDLTPEAGWRIDAFRQPLPGEAPGQPERSGSWDLACRLARDYDFAEPSIVRALYDPREPLERRNMLLELRFRALRFYVGVRVGDVYDDTREVDGRPGRVFGWNYRTLEGHLEQGQMDWQVWKWLESGDVEFRIHALSRSARGGNPVIRAGFRLFGRREQVKFLRRTCARMARLTAAELAGDAGAIPAPANDPLENGPRP